MNRILFAVRTQTRCINNLTLEEAHALLSRIGKRGIRARIVAY